MRLRKTTVRVLSWHPPEEVPIADDELLSAEVVCSLEKATQDAKCTLDEDALFIVECLEQASVLETELGDTVAARSASLEDDEVVIAAVVEEETDVPVVAGEGRRSSKKSTEPRP